jgi:hypothetical protein
VSAHGLPPIEAHYPSTFRERGVAAPFTSPLLAGARVRAADRQGIELVLANPSGAPGVYILHWSDANEAYRPTLHDSVLLRRLANRGTLHPRTVRAAAWDVAGVGLAGREARVAAKAAADSDRSERRLAVFLLLSALFDQAEPHGPRLTSLLRQPSVLDHRISEVLHRLAPAFGCTGPRLRGTLAALGSVFAPVGVSPDDGSSLVARLTGQLLRTRDQIATSFLDGKDSESVPLIRSVVDSMDTVLACARTSIADARALITDPLTLLKHWIATPEKVVELVTRAEWVLDGWERISLLWQFAPDDAAQRGVMPEMAQLVPALPSEVVAWVGTAVPAGALDPACRVTWQNDSGRKGGVAFLRVGRNEQLRAMSQ